MKHRVSGFTLVELLVVMIIIGIMAAIAIPYHNKTVEFSRADLAMSSVQMVATTNRMYALDHGGIYTSGGPITASCNNSCCTDDPGCAVATTDPCNLVACKYIAMQDFDTQAYVLYPANGKTAAACGSAVPSLVPAGALPYAACTFRRTGASPGTDTRPYMGWGYTVDKNGVVTPRAISGDTMPPSPSS